MLYCPLSKPLAISGKNSLPLVISPASSTIWTYNQEVRFDYTVHSSWPSFSFIFSLIDLILCINTGGCCDESVPCYSAVCPSGLLIVLFTAESPNLEMSLASARRETPQSHVGWLSLSV